MSVSDEKLPRNTETLQMRRDLLSFVTKRTQSAEVLFTRLRNEWGTITTRRCWRMLRWLIELGAVAKYDDKGDGYTLGKPFKIKTTMLLLDTERSPSRLTPLWIPQIEEHW